MTDFLNSHVDVKVLIRGEVVEVGRVDKLRSWHVGRRGDYSHRRGVAGASLDLSSVSQGKVRAGRTEVDNCRPKPGQPSFHVVQSRPISECPQLFVLVAEATWPSAGTWFPSRAKPCWTWSAERMWDVCSSPVSDASAGNAPAPGGEASASASVNAGRRLSQSGGLPVAAPPAAADDAAAFHSHSTVSLSFINHQRL